MKAYSDAVAGSTTLRHPKTKSRAVTGRPSLQRIPLQRPLVLADLVSLRLAVGGNLETGKTYQLRTFDPMMMQERDISLHVEAESTFVVPDSAVYDSTTRHWRPASYDTVRAFRVTQTWNGLTGTMPNGERLSSGGGKFTDWTLGVNFSVPLGLRSTSKPVMRAASAVRKITQQLQPDCGSCVAREDQLQWLSFKAMNRDGRGKVFRSDSQARGADEAGLLQDGMLHP